MHYFQSIRFLIFPLLMVAAGCEPASHSSGTPDKVTHANDKSATDSDSHIAKVAVLKDGTVLVNSKQVVIDAFASALDSINGLKEIWYHRESPDAVEPHENATKVIKEIAARKLPIAMYLDQDFTQRMTMGK